METKSKIEEHKIKIIKNEKNGANCKIKVDLKKKN